MSERRSGAGGNGRRVRSRRGRAGGRPAALVVILVSALAWSTLAVFGCGSDTTTTTPTPTTAAIEAPTTTTTEVAETTTTTLTGFAAIVPQGFPMLELPTDASLISSDPPVGEIGATVTAFYAHEADVMEESQVWKQKLKDAGFTLTKNQAWTGAGLHGYIVRGSTADEAFDFVVVGGDALAIERNPFYDVPAETIPGELESGFVVVLTAN